MSSERKDQCMSPAEPHTPTAGIAPESPPDSRSQGGSSYRGPHAAIAVEAPEASGRAIDSKSAAAVPGSLHFPMIDVLRGFAAGSVIVYHTIEHLNWQAFPVQGPAVWFRVGWMSVDLFFVISGFVITLSAVRGISKASGRNEFRRDFMRRRVARIVPLHYLTCLVFLVFIMPMALGRPRLWLHLITHATFLHNWHPATQGSINGVNWSLGVEMQFYLIVMLAAGWLARTRPVALVATCLGVSWLWRAAAYGIFHDRIAFHTNLTWIYTSQVFGMLDLFGWGGALALIVARDTDGSARRWLTRWWLWAGAAVLIGWPTMKLYWAYASYWNVPAMVVFWRSGMGLVWVLAVAAACGLGAGRVARISAPLRYLGTISFGLYLWHLPVIESLKRTGLVHAPQRFLAVTLGLTALLAAGSWHFFEKPFMEKHGK
jgi:peptidoglycan/LPS O-acetylase OafA/YrhL